MANQHPITPTLELMREWAQWNQGDTDPEDLWLRLCTRAAQWGADTELEAVIHLCDEWLTAETIRRIRAARRPKPPSLKEQALADLDTLVGRGRSSDTIRRALEALPDD